MFEFYERVSLERKKNTLEKVPNKKFFREKIIFSYVLNFIDIVSTVSILVLSLIAL